MDALGVPLPAVRLWKQNFRQGTRKWRSQTPRAFFTGSIARLPAKPFHSSGCGEVGRSHLSRARLAAHLEDTDNWSISHNGLFLRYPCSDAGWDIYRNTRMGGTPAAQAPGPATLPPNSDIFFVCCFCRRDMFYMLLLQKVAYLEVLFCL